MAQTQGNRRERPAKPALSRAGIITTAVGLVRAEGLDRVTMRRLAQALDTGPASLYVYVRNTAELHAAVLDELLGGIARPPEGGTWRERLIKILLSYVGILFEYPGLAQSALVARPSGPGYLTLLEALLALLDEGGVPRDRAAWAVDLLLQFGTATAAEHTTRNQTAAAQDRARPVAEGPDEHDALRVALRAAGAQGRPHLAAAAGELLSGTGAERLTWGFHVLINGTVHTARQPAVPSNDL